MDSASGESGEAHSALTSRLRLVFDRAFRSIPSSKRWWFIALILLYDAADAGAMPKEPAAPGSGALTGAKGEPPRSIAWKPCIPVAGRACETGIETGARRAMPTGE